MNLFEQSEEVVREMERIGSFRRQVKRRTTMRQQYPGSGIRHQARVEPVAVRLEEPAETAVDRLVPHDANGTRTPLQRGRKVKSLLQDHPLRPHNDLQVTGERLHGKFSALTWLALENVTRIWIRQIPAISLVGILDAMRRLVSLLAVPVAFLATLGAYTTVELRLRHLDMSDDRIAAGLSVLTCLAVVLLIVLVIRHRARKRLQGTLGKLGYMGIRARQGSCPRPGNEPRNQGRLPPGFGRTPVSFNCARMTLGLHLTCLPFAHGDRRRSPGINCVTLT